MKNKLKFLVNMSLMKKIKNKWFAIANVIIFLLVIGLANIDHVISFFGGDFNDTTKIYVVDKTDSYDILKANLNEANKITKSEFKLIKSEDSIDNLTKLIKENKDEKKSIVLSLQFDKENILKVDMISNNFIDTLNMNIISSAIDNCKTSLAIKKYNFTDEELLALKSKVTINRIILDETKDSKDENMQMIMSTVFPVFILPFFMLIIFLVQMIGAEVNDEKTTRGMEIIISNVSPEVHFFSKCISGNLFILIQSCLLITYGIMGFLSRSIFSNTGNILGGFNEISLFINKIFNPSFLDQLKYLIPLIIILMIVTFIGYSLLAGILASMTTNTEDFQQLQTPIVIISLLGYYLAMVAGTFKGSVIIKIFGYIPFISAILSPSLLVIGDFTIIDVIISIVLMVIVIYLLIKYGLKIYKVGILNYSQTNLWKKMFKALKN